MRKIITGTTVEELETKLQDPSILKVEALSGLSAVCDVEPSRKKGEPVQTVQVIKRYPSGKKSIEKEIMRHQDTNVKDDKYFDASGNPVTKEEFDALPKDKEKKDKNK